MAHTRSPGGGDMQAATIRESPGGSLPHGRIRIRRYASGAVIKSEPEWLGMTYASCGSKQITPLNFDLPVGDPPIERPPTRCAAPRIAKADVEPARSRTPSRGR